MTAAQAEAYLLDLELFGMRFGLDRMHRLMTALGMPQRRFASIHVVGSNGKSSTVRMIAAILEAHGLRTGSYTSPHLRSFAERIEVGGRRIEDGDFAGAVDRAARAATLVDRTLGRDDRVTQFEALTAAAYYELGRRRVDVAIVEAGLGGRYDATNVIPSRVQVLTTIALEHTRWLGPTLADIAAEKLAIVRRHGHLVTGELPAEVDALAARSAADLGAAHTRASPLDESIELRALGPVARRNFGVACAAAAAFLGELDAEAVERAGATVEIPGRLEVVADEPLVIHDGAHNPAGAAALAESLPALIGARRLTAVVSVLDDKDAAGILAALLPLCERAIYTRSASPRSLPPATLASLAEKVGATPYELIGDPVEAMKRARDLAGDDDAILATGSLHLVADLVRDRASGRMSSL